MAQFIQVYFEGYIEPDLEDSHGWLVVKEDPHGIGVLHWPTQRVVVLNRGTCRHLIEHQAFIIGVVPPVLPNRQID